MSASESEEMSEIDDLAMESLLFHQIVYLEDLISVKKENYELKRLLNHDVQLLDEQIGYDEYCLNNLNDEYQTLKDDLRSTTDIEKRKRIILISNIKHMEEICET